MSGAGERWRRSGPGNRQSQDTRSGSSTPTSRQQSMPGFAGNAWAAGKGKAAGGAAAGQVVNAPAPAPVPGQGGSRGAGASANLAELTDFLKRRYTESSQETPLHYKVQGDSVSKRSSGAWGTRGNMSHLMPNGQDFFTQLKKQLVALDSKSS